MDQLQANTSYLPGSHKSLTWAPEMIMLFWEALQCNKRFRSFIIDTDRAHDFVVLILYYAIDQRNDPSKQGLVRMCIFVLQTLSVEPQFGKSLNKTFEGQESLPPSIRIPNFHGTYADYVVTVCTQVNNPAYANAISPFTHYSLPAKVDWKQSTLLCLLFSITLQLTCRTLAEHQAPSFSNCSLQCHHQVSCSRTRTITLYSTPSSKL